MFHFLRHIIDKAEPCGIPLITFFHFDLTPCTHTHWVLPQRNDLIHFSRSPFIPTLSSFRSNLSCATESKALAKSVYITSNVSPLSIRLVQSSMHSNNCVIQFLSGTNPCWSSVSIYASLNAPLLHLLLWIP